MGQIKYLSNYSISLVTLLDFKIFNSNRSRDKKWKAELDFRLLQSSKTALNEVLAPSCGLSGDLSNRKAALPGDSRFEILKDYFKYSDY